MERTAVSLPVRKAFEFAGKLVGVYFQWAEFARQRVHEFEHDLTILTASTPGGAEQVGCVALMKTAGRQRIGVETACGVFREQDERHVQSDAQQSDTCFFHSLKV